MPLATFGPARPVTGDRQTRSALTRGSDADARRPASITLFGVNAQICQCRVGPSRTALDRMRFRLQSPSLEIPEQECVPSETAKYNRLFGVHAAGVGGTAK